MLVGGTAPGLMPLVPAGSTPVPLPRAPRYQLCGLAPALRSLRCPLWCCTARSGRPRSAPLSGSCPSHRRGRLWLSPHCRGPAGPRCTSAKRHAPGSGQEAAGQRHLAGCSPPQHPLATLTSMPEGKCGTGRDPMQPVCAPQGASVPATPWASLWPHAQHHPGPVPGVVGIYLGESHVRESIQGEGGLGAQLPLLLPL